MRFGTKIFIACCYVPSHKENVIGFTSYAISSLNRHKLHCSWGRWDFCRGDYHYAFQYERLNFHNPFLDHD